MFCMDFSGYCRDFSRFLKNLANLQNLHERNPWMLTVIRKTDGSKAKRRVFSGLTNGSCNQYYVTQNFEGGKSEIIITG